MDTIFLIPSEFRAERDLHFVSEREQLDSDSSRSIVEGFVVQPLDQDAKPRDDGAEHTVDGAHGRLDLFKHFRGNDYGSLDGNGYIAKATGAAILGIVRIPANCRAGAAVQIAPSR